MNRVKEFFLGLNKSTRITLISCGCFILLTFIILMFFVFFPITPSEKAIARIGREGLVYNETDEQQVTTAVTENNNTPAETTTTTVTTTTGVTTEPVRITFTTPEGFYIPGYIQTGEVGVNNFTTTTSSTEESTEDPSETTTTTTEPGTEDPTDEPGIEDPTDEPSTDPTDAPSTDPTDPPVTEQPATTPPETPDAEQAVSEE
ncbi:MAG: hypothetical protein IKM49_05015 [Ruminococcus sp.]|nr:hypothetical protein [Ruminococcus sp.]